MIKAVVLEVLVDEDPALPLDAAAQQPDEVRVLDFGNALDFGKEFLDPLLGFRGQNLCSKCGAISPNSLCVAKRRAAWIKLRIPHPHSKEDLLAVKISKQQIKYFWIQYLVHSSKTTSA
jgi:hypothetical protein